MHLSELSTFFDMTERTVRRALARSPEDPLPFGRYCVMDAIIESALVTMLLDVYQRGEPMTNKELLKTVREQYNPKLTKG
jgi:hypothetical protein